MRIIIPLDGSLRAEAVLHPLTVLARRALAPISVTLVAVQETAGTDAHLPSYLAAIRQRADLVPFTVETVQVTGEPAASICAIAAQRQATLILMASHMATLDPLTGESVAEMVARCSQMPTLIVRPDGMAFPDLPRFTPLTMGVILAEARCEVAVVASCIPLAQAFDANLLLLHSRADTNEAEDARAYAKLTVLAHDIEQQGIAATRMVTHVPAATQLAAMIASGQIAIIALPLLAEGAMRQKAIGASILRDVNAPTLLFHAPICP